jgi:hypothetical protein
LQDKTYDVTGKIVTGALVHLVERPYVDEFRTALIRFGQA